jgi:competence protein ComFC
MANVLPLTVRFKRVALDLLFPRWCLGCGREGDYICGTCRRSLPEITPPVCPGCGRPHDGGGVCPRCAAGKPAILAIRSPFQFDGVVRRAIHELKYRNLRDIARPMAGLLNEYLAASPLPGEVLVPVPLHPKRQRERGYNQSALLARELGRLSGLPVVESCLVRRQHTPPQARTASAAERQHNVAGAFACRDGRLRGREVLLVDDVATSGATLNACALALKSRGSPAVRGLVMAMEI